MDRNTEIRENRLKSLRLSFMICGRNRVKGLIDESRCFFIEVLVNV